jgi:hypothetical protein
VARRSSSFSLLFDTRSFLRQLVSAILSWAMIMSSMPLDGASRAPISRLTLRAGLEPPAAPPAAPQPAAGIRGKKLKSAGPSPLLAKSAPRAMRAMAPLPTGLPDLRMASEPVSLSKLSALAGATPVRILSGGFVFQSGGGSGGALAVSVGYADNLRANPSFPVPWQGSPNVLFLGSGPSFDAGAIRLDNLSGSPLTIDSVVVDLGRPGPTFNLWGSFTIPAQSSAILTQRRRPRMNFSWVRKTRAGQPCRLRGASRLPATLVSLMLETARPTALWNSGRQMVRLF